MSRYRKIEVKLWGDEKFRRLTPLQPSGQALWLYLLTGPHTTQIPGLYRAGKAAMAEDLGWSTEALHEALQEALNEGMAEADFSARVIWIKNAINYNTPESVNVVKSWAGEWELIPECDLKREAWDTLKARLDAISEAYGKAFVMACRKPNPKPNSMPNGKGCANQEQEQEQEQDKVNIVGANTETESFALTPQEATETPPSQPPAKPKTRVNGKEVSEVIEYLNHQTGKAFRVKTPDGHKLTTNAEIILARLREGYTPSQAKLVIGHMTDKWGRDDKMRDYLTPQTLFRPSNFPKYLAEAESAQ